MLIVSDSIAKYVTDIRSAEVIPYPGITINGLTAVVQLVLDKQFTIFHVGTNDIPRLEEKAILSCFNNFITVVKQNSRTTILMSSILPRPKDYSVSKEKVKNVNKELKKLCRVRNIRFLHSFKPFLKYGDPVREFFAVRDGGLHLNNEGIRRLRFFFINTVAHLLKEDRTESLPCFAWGLSL